MLSSLPVMHYQLEAISLDYPTITHPCSGDHEHPVNYRLLHHITTASPQVTICT